MKFGDYEFVHQHLLWSGMCKFYGQGLWTFHKKNMHQRDGHMLSNRNGNKDNGLGVDVGADMNDFLRACLYPTQENPSGAPIAESDDFRRLVEESNTPM